MRKSVIVVNLVVLATCLSNCDVKKDSTRSFTNRVLLIDLNDAPGIALDTLLATCFDQFNDKLCFLEPNTGKVQIVTSKEAISEDVYFNDILAICVIGKNKYVNMLDDVKRKIVIQFRQPNRNTLMTDATLYQFSTGSVEKKLALGSRVVDIKHPEKFLVPYIEFALKLGVRDPLSINLIN